jgi:DNA-binding response OmpR family regulator
LVRPDSDSAGTRRPAGLTDAIRLVNIVCFNAEVLAKEPLDPPAQRLADRVLTTVSEVAEILAALGGLEPVLRCGAIEVDSRGHRVRVNGHDVDLALADFSLLSVLVAHADTVVPHDRLQELAWGKRLPTANALYAHVNRVRRALEHHGVSADRLQVVRGMGYRLSAR